MKIQTSAVVEELHIDNKLVDLGQGLPIDLEFSAIDTGGGFRDPILDFSFRFDLANLPKLRDQEEYAITFDLIAKEANQDGVEMKCEVPVNIIDEQKAEINGRLKEEQLNRELIGFVLNLLR